MLPFHRQYLKPLAARLQHDWITPKGHDTGIKVYNCVARDTVPLIVSNRNAVGWYTCGPTVYDSAHIGHASCYVKLDIIQRILRGHFHMNLVTVMNITDVDDKIIKRSRDEGVPPEQVAGTYEKEFWMDMTDLGVRRPDKVVRVTERMPEILRFVDGLLGKGLAYGAQDSSVYFDVTAYGERYGKLQNIGDAVEDEGCNVKRSAADFALWKGAKEGEPSWASKFGPGRPGWHIECSAIAGTVLGSTIDIHAGGIDLRFPHHENEEAQCCAYFGTGQWTNYWLHAGHLHLKDSVKMSKSLKNTVSIRDMLRMCNPDVFRVACLMSPYRNNMEFGEELVHTAKAHLKTYRNFVHECRLYIDGRLKASLDPSLVMQSLATADDDVHRALCDNFDTASCLKAVGSLIGSCNKMLHSAADSGGGDDGVASLVAVSNYVGTLFDTFGVNLNVSSDVKGGGDELASVMDALVGFRKDVRELGIRGKNKEILQLCDGLRDSVKQCGFTLNDRGKVSTWSK